jgi:hypothetical protein
MIPSDWLPSKVSLSVVVLRCTSGLGWWKDNAGFWAYLTTVNILKFCIFADEWSNFLERVNITSADPETEIFGNVEKEDQLRVWASFRGQTLSRTGISTFLALHVLFFSISGALYLISCILPGPKVHSFSGNVFQLLCFSRCGSEGYDVLPKSIGASGLSGHGNRRWYFLQSTNSVPMWSRLCWLCHSCALQ